MKSVHSRFRAHKIRKRALSVEIACCHGPAIKALNCCDSIRYIHVGHPVTRYIDHYLLQENFGTRLSTARSKKWVVKPIPERKQYSYLHDMVEDVIRLRLNGSQEDICEIEIPDTIPKNIAPEVRLNKDKIIKEHCSRFSYCVTMQHILYSLHKYCPVQESSSYGSYGT